MYVRPLVLGLLATVVCSRLAMAMDHATLVAASYPPYLVELEADSIKTGGKSFGHYQAHTSFQHGADTIIVAAYTNYNFGRVRAFVLDAEGRLARIEEPELLMGGRYPAVELRELNGSAPAEIVATFEDDRGSSTWIFGWADGGLKFLSADPEKSEETSMRLPDFIDIDGDGTSEIVDTAMDKDDEGEVVPVYSYFKLENGTYGAPRSVALWTDVARRRGAPAVYETSFASDSIHGTLWIVNGGGNGAPVTSAQIVLNGTTIVTPAQMNPTVARLTKPVTLAADNELSVRLAGKPGAQLHILITRD